MIGRKFESSIRHLKIVQNGEIKYQVKTIYLNTYLEQHIHVKTELVLEINKSRRN